MKRKYNANLLLHDNFYTRVKRNQESEPLLAQLCWCHQYGAGGVVSTIVVNFWISFALKYWKILLGISLIHDVCCWCCNADTMAATTTLQFYNDKTIAGTVASAVTTMLCHSTNTCQCHNPNIVARAVYWHLCQHHHTSSDWYHCWQCLLIWLCQIMPIESHIVVCVCVFACLVSYDCLTGQSFCYSKFEFSTNVHTCNTYMNIYLLVITIVSFIWQSYLLFHIYAYKLINVSWTKYLR